MRAEPHILSPHSGHAIQASPRSYGNHITRRSLIALLARLTEGAVTLIDGDERFELGQRRAELSATVTIVERSAYGAILLGGSLGAGEAYVKGLWTCDDLPTLARIFARNVAVLDAMDAGLVGFARRVAGALAAVSRRNTRSGSRRNIARHYDLSNELFELFLDESMTYSSAIFERDDATLAEAQRTKLERICRKLELGPRDHLLEIGTGWGALAIHAASQHGCRVTTTTVSEQQYRLAVARVREAGLQDRVEVLLRDYRDLEGQFDKLVSVEMIEAVGHPYLDDYFRACSRHLAPRGAMLLQAITIADQHHERHRRSNDFIKEHVFPGSCIPSVTSIVSSTTRATDLRLYDLEDLTPHYATTLRCWRERFRDRADQVRQLGFDDEFIRLWEYYLAYCEGGFAERYLGCVHMVFTKPDGQPAAGLRRLT